MTNSRDWGFGIRDWRNATATAAVASPREPKHARTRSSESPIPDPESPLQRIIHPLVRNRPDRHDPPQRLGLAAGPPVPRTAPRRERRPAPPGQRPVDRELSQDLLPGLGARTVTPPLIGT